ncbi:SpoIIE family protein phosphatase [Conexibacter sp. JD483]|uniref:PP2C family protein-serine/threonine phosphatase n=1 Tax=unclassified Conexibacter TaxID=2627773 RepID=UPI00271FB885|nr:MULTISPECIES: SpoIIE family protein phosphatase [unclassified Conexibacter]MDO8185411.1 SpoIIE family protein phosphatase [Conexibacter sp. CPCC 205706]MDO8198413.1 SpoIIE family protein phosphatase [Conexibacter sp. CPCC 205762]MDR9369375.1 SpoIIE family protein phosphatase [Conexibacter sp. JD483]
MGGTTRDQLRATDGGFGARYQRAFLRYLQTGDEADVTPAYELSREAVGGHLSLLELAEAHREAFAAGVLPERDAERQQQLAERAAAFLRESLATFEIAHRGYLEVQEVARLEHEHARQLQSVAEVSVALNAALPVADVIDLVTAEARHVLGGRSARAHLELPGSQPRRTLTATSGEPPAEHAREAPGALRASLTGRRGLVVGEIEVFGVEDADPGAEAILVQLAQVASAAIGNAQIYGLEREIAETLQRSLLPQRLPKVDGLDIDARYCAAGDGMVVGGDFYDVFRTNGTAWGVAIGDVCGKGPHAAALTALVRYTLRAAALWEHRPERVMAMLNEAILDQRDDHRFCTAFYGQLQLTPAGGARVDFVSAGHPLPIVRRAGGAVETVGSYSTVLGVVPDPQLHADTVELAPGDLLVLYTDGVTEVRRRGREVFGVDQLLALLGEIGDVSAAKAAERVEDAVLNASGGPPRDDLAVIAVRIPPA